ncbi:MAG: hypothetical protein JW915_16635 [Chitinispirillaceae bacterium]|nr:hypothetical protein [Chitinispirillaceae bacterium]
MNKQSYNPQNKGLTFIIAVLIIGHLIGTTTHTLLFFDVLKLGFLNSSKAFGVSTIVNAYWVSLTIIDPLIAILLIKRRRTGVLLAFINILINVAVNSSIQLSSLKALSLSSIYDSLGNIFNGLQIALLLFSTITLPLFFIKPTAVLHKKINYFRFFHFIPIIALFIGLIIHCVGLIKLLYKFESLWVLWVHVSMLFFNGGLIYALWKKLRTGYIAGIIGFSIFGLIQAGYAGAIYIGFDCPFNLAMAVTISICCLAIAALLLNRDMYILSLNNRRQKTLDRCS